MKVKHVQSGSVRASTNCGDLRRQLTPGAKPKKPKEPVNEEFQLSEATAGFPATRRSRLKKNKLPFASPQKQMVPPKCLPKFIDYTADDIPWAISEHIHTISRIFRCAKLTQIYNMKTRAEHLASRTQVLNFVKTVYCPPQRTLFSV